ncbi:MAG: adenylyl-sulfate kinase [Thermostichales cyanobacterium DRC_bins_46]
MTQVTSVGKSTNIVWHAGYVTRAQRERLNNHKSLTLWFTGLSGSGKSTLSHGVERRLFEMGCRTYVLDGDNVRHGLNSDLGFSDADRVENIRRVGETAKLFMDAGLIVLTAFISPFRSDRRLVRQSMAPGDFVEIYCHSPLEICEQRDVKGLYRRARAGEIPNFTGISSPYEVPEQPELILNTGSDSVETCINQVIDYLLQRGVVTMGRAFGEEAI